MCVCIVYVYELHAYMWDSTPMYTHVEKRVSSFEEVAILQDLIEMGLWVHRKLNIWVGCMDRKLPASFFVPVLWRLPASAATHS